MRLLGTGRFKNGPWGRQIIKAERDLKDPKVEDDEKPAPAEIAGIYRQLRTSLEDSKDFAGASDFYYGEMRMRQKVAVHSNGFRAKLDGAIMAIYWLISGYGLRAWRAFATFAVVVAASVVLFRLGGQFDPECVASPAETCDGQTWAETAVFTFKGSVSFLRAPADGALTVGENIVMIALRLLAPALFALAILALRARIRR
jgi:hypothetical protein